MSLENEANPKEMPSLRVSAARAFQTAEKGMLFHTDAGEMKLQTPELAKFP